MNKKLEEQLEAVAADCTKSDEEVRRIFNTIRDRCGLLHQTSVRCLEIIGIYRRQLKQQIESNPYGVQLRSA